MDTIGGIPVVDPPTIADFPIAVDYGGGIDYNPEIITHVFDVADLQTEQRFVMGPGTRRIRVRRDHLNKDEYSLLKNHYLQAQAQYASFKISVLGPQGMEQWNVRYENPAIAFDHMAGMLTGDPGLTLLVLPDAAIPWTSAQQVIRFPDSNLATNLAAQTQHIFPLVIIQDRERKPDGSLKNPPNYFSNQRVIVDGKTYLPRLLTWSGVTQTISETSDSANFTFGNADDIFTKWGNQTDLYRAAVQFSLYHAESGYLIYIWGGYARPWSLDTTGRFVLPCSSGTFELTLGYPTRTITRWCWKVYKGMHCPSTASFPTCPKDYDSCVARGVPTSFGGLVVPAQAVRVKDSSSGVLGWGRSWMTSVTITSDSIYQNTLQEVWTDEPMFVTAPVMAGRDEDQYYAGLGMVSDGPIGGYSSNLALQTLDNYIPHDPFKGGGFRGVVGNDPCENPDWDYIGISQEPWDVAPPKSTYSAGLAFAEIRRIDAVGLQLSTPNDHSMQVSVTQGVSGWVWDSPGNRRWVPGLANTAWVAVNVYLRGLGLRVSNTNAAQVPAATMEQYFDVNQAIYVASICDLLVGKVLGGPQTTSNTAIGPGSQTVTVPNATGLANGMTLAVDVAPNQELVLISNVTMNNSQDPTQGGSFHATFSQAHPAGAVIVEAELQFPFRGIFKERKPLKDWLTEIMKCCNGYWTFVNGRLWLGIRENASVGNANAYTQDHLKWKTLQVTPPAPQFNWLDVQFGDEEFSWTLNKVTYYDEDHAKKVGIPENPQYLQASMTLVGVSNLSQATRCAVTRCREELGGIVVKDSVGNIITDEQKAARNISFSTTVLALTTLVGDVISLTHPKMPGGSGKARVQSWQLNPDFSIDIQATCVTPSMYALDMGPKPADVAPPPLIDPKQQLATGMAWMPGYLAPIVNDPLYLDMTERTFELWQDYTLAKDGSWSPAIWVQGRLMVNTVFSVDAPRIADIKLQGGGNLGGGQTLYFAIVVQDANHLPAKPSASAAVWIPANLANQQIALTFFPPAATAYSYWALYAGPDRRVMAYQDGGAGTLPSTYTFQGPLHRYTYGLPSPAAQWVQIGVKHAIHAGVAGMLLSSIPAGQTNQIQCNDFIGSTDNWVGRVVSAIADESTGYAPLLNYTCVAFDGSTGIMTVFPDCVIPGKPEQSVEVNDVFIVRSIAESVSTDGLTITDSLWNNFVAQNQFGSAGLAANAEIGNVARVLRGAGMGQSAAITSNTATSITLAQAMTGLDHTSIIVIEQANWAYTGQSTPVPVPKDGQLVQVRIPVDNLANQVALVGGFLNDGVGHVTDDRFAVFREIFVFGQAPVVRTLGPGPGPFDVDPTDQTINVDTSQNNVTLTLPPLSTYEGRTLLIFNLFAHQVIIQTYTPAGGTQETFYDGSTQQVITAQGGSLRITSTGDYSPTARARYRRSRLR